MDTRSPRLRMNIFGVVVIGCFLALFARLWYLQVMAAPALEVKASALTTRTVTVEAPRGRILDAQGRVIVDNRTSLVVTVNPHDLSRQSHPEQTIQKLATTLTDYGAPTKVADIEAKLNDKQYDPIQPVPVATDVPEALWIYLSEHADEYPGVSVARRSVRSYNPFFAGVGGNILGYVGRISAEAYAKAQRQPPPKDPVTGAPKTYEPDSTIGLAGVEATYEAELRGTPGIETIEVDAHNRPVRRLSYQPPRPGDDIQLNVDFELQAQTEHTLDAQLAATRGGIQPDPKGVIIKKAPAGSAVVLDPYSGAVKALATYPRYDPAEFVNGISQARYQQLTDQGGASALVDRSISGVYAPGSTFKLVTATSALANHVITPSTGWNDTGTFEIGGQRFTSTGANGFITLPTAITVSSDTFFYNLGAKMDGTNDIQNTADAYGYARSTGIDLPGESTGYVLTPADKKALHAKYPNAYPYGEWFTGDNVQLAIGQNTVAVTPIQLANAYATFANGGTVYQPHVVAQVLKPGSPANVPIDKTDPANVLQKIDPKPTGKVDLPSSIWEPIFQGLNNVTKSGTAVQAFKGFDQSKFSIVGKTGTAQVTGKADTSLFASYAPSDKPQYAVAAVLEESGFGSDAAAPVVRHIYEVLTGQQQSAFVGAVGGKGD